MNILFFGASASCGTGYGLLMRNIGRRLHKLGKKKVKCSDCERESYLEPSLNKCDKCDSENIKILQEADKSYKGPYHNVFQMGLHTIGEVDERYGFPILPVGSNDPCGSDLLPYYITQYNIDVLITMKDLFPDQFGFIKRVVMQTGVYWINHCTIFSTPLSPFRAKNIRFSDLVVAPSNFAHQTIKNGGFDNVKRIYHGVDLNVFKPNPKQRAKDRKELKTEDKFIFLTVAKNVPLQKDYPVLFHAYKTFLKNVEGAKEKTILHIHANPQELDGYDLDLMAERFGLGKNVIFTGGHNSNFTLPPERMAEIYNYADVLCVASTGESFCLDPNTLITTDNGTKSINKICLDDNILSHTGNLRKITKLMKRNYKGKMIKIKVYGSSEEVIITPEHPVLVSKKSRSLNKEEWKPASELNKGDLLLLPIAKQQFKDTIYDINKINPLLQYDEKEVWFSSKYSPKLKKIIRKKIPRFIKLDKDLGKLMGWYIAEGDVGNMVGAGFSFHEKEKEYINEVIALMKSKFSMDYYNYSRTKGSKGIHIYFCSKVLADFFSNLCGKGSKNKRIPKEILYGDKKILKETIDTIFKGDGHKSHNRLALSSSSYKLINDVKVGLLRLGIPATAMKFIRKRKFNTDEIFTSYEYQLSYYIPRTNHSVKCIKFNDDYFGFRVRKIEQINYNGEVYNMEIDKDNTYCTSSFIVHNCFPIIEAMACGKPVIAMNFSSPIELITNSAAGLLAEIKGTWTTKLLSELCFIDELSYAKCMGKIYEDEKLRERLSANALKFAKSFDWDLIVKEWGVLLK